MMQKIRLSQRVESEARAVATDPVAIAIESSLGFRPKTK
jgi:hypothetical protein